MAKCMICKRDSFSGYVLCKHCAGTLEPDSLLPQTAFVLDQLAEEIVLSGTIPACRMCELDGCDSQVSGLVCRTGVKNWLTDRAKEYLSTFSKPSN